MAYIYSYTRKQGNKKKTFYEYRIRYKDPITQNFKEKCKKGFTSKKAAERAALEEEIRIEQGFEITSDTLVNYLYQWLDKYKKGTIRKNTYDIHKNNIKTHIQPYFKNILLSSLRPIMYQDFINSLDDKGLSKRTVEIIHGTVYSACEKAIILGKIERNPCKGVTIKGEKKNNELKFIDSGDIPHFLKTAYQDNYIYWIYFKCLLETGMRKGEAGALQWTDIDFKKLTISINKTMDFQEMREEGYFGDTKTYHSTRVINISQSLANDLQFHMKWQNKNKLSLNDIYKHNLNLVFCKVNGERIPKSTLFNAFRRILRNANLPEMPIHSTRHTHAVLLLESGADMKYIQERLGHGSMQITADVYSHVSKKIEQSNMNRYEQHTADIFKK